MKIFINGQEKNIPTSLSQITLQQRIDFQNIHGNELDEMAKSIVEMKDETEKELETIQFQLEKMYRSISFFADVAIEALKEYENVDQIANIYYSTLSVLFEDESKMELKREYVWNNEVWILHEPELKGNSNMTFGEFIDSKQIIRDMVELGKGRWEHLLPLCAIYLRKKDEPYDEQFIQEGSERIELFKSLPLDIALAVGFFLTASMSIYINSFQYSLNPGLKDPAHIAKNILKDGAGLTS